MSAATVAGSTPVDRRNFLLNAGEGAIYAASTALINPQTVLPALVYELGGNSVLVGLLTILVSLGLYLPQLFAARYIETLPWKKPWAVGFGAVHRFLALVIAIVILLFGRSSPSSALWLFFLVFTVMQLTIGVSTPGWFDMFAKMTPAGARGRLFGIRTSVGGGGAFLCGLGMTWLLSSIGFPTSYALLFFVSFIMQVVSLVMQMGLMELEPSATDTRRNFGAFLRELPQELRANPPFRDFLIACSLLTVATMPMGFYTVYALKTFRASGQVVGEFTSLMVAVQVVSALVNGYIADRYGSKLALLVASGGLLGASLIALAAPTLGYFRLVYPLLGINLGTETMMKYNMSIAFGPTRKRSIYVGMMNTVLAPLYLCGLAGGVISELWGFPVVFLIGVGFSIGGIAFLLLRVSEPRAQEPGRS